MTEETVNLLQECNAGIKMGVTSLDDVLGHVRDDGLKNLLLKSKDTHSRLGNKTHEYLVEYQEEGKEPAVMAKVMSWFKSNMKLEGENSDSMAADIITDGCNMGIKSLYKYLHQYPKAEQKVKDLTGELIRAEETLVEDLREYL